MRSPVFCPNLACVARGQVGQGNIVSHGQARARYRCKICRKTFSTQAGTMFEGLRKPKALTVIVVTLLAYGCPIQAIVQAFGLDERTVASWRDSAGKQCQQVHQAIVQQGQLDLVHVQADEIRVKGCNMIAWVGLAMMVSTRLWLGGVVNLTRDCSLANRLLAQARSCCQPLRARLLCTDGWNDYPGSIRRAFRKTRQRDRRTRASLFAGVAADVYCRGDQTDTQETRGGTHAQDGSRNAGTSAGVAFGFSGRNGAQYRLYRTLERHDPPTTRQLDAQMSACGQALGSAGKRHVAGFAVPTICVGPIMN
jgi:transposase-like protein